MEDVGLLYAHLVFWSPFDMFYGHFGMLYQEKSGNHGPETARLCSCLPVGTWISGFLARLNASVERVLELQTIF
jgi:hypothetical protein